MRKLVVEPLETKFISRLAIFFLLFFVAVTVSTLLRMAGNASGAALLGIMMYLIFASVIGALLLFSLRRLRAREKAAAMLASSSGIENGTITFPEELEFEYGRLILGERPAKEFRAEGKGKGRSIPFMNGEFRLLITPEGEGFASFPAVKILSRPYEGVMLLFMTSEGRVVCRKSLSIPTSEGSLHLDLEGMGRTLRGRIYSTPEKTEKIRVLLGIPEWGGMEVRVAGGAIREFRYSMLPDEKTVIYAPYGALSLSGIARKLERKGVVLGHGEFLIRFTVEGHLKKRYSSRESFKVLMGENEWGI